MMTIVENYERSLCTENCDELFKTIDAMMGQADPLPISLWKSACHALASTATKTWWKCKCGPIEPNTYSIDALCPSCNEFRVLPQRMQRSPWPLYIICLQHIYPDTWFDALFAWMKQKYPETEIKAGVCPKDIAGKGSAVLPSAIGARGATPPVPNAIHCIDGMIIEETGSIRGLQWIALPMMPVE